MQTDTQQIKNLPIGVFDSGIGGLTVVREIMKQMPDERIVYFGDTARVPYGNKSKETVTKFSEQIVRFLIQQNVKAIAVACNTASAQAFPALRESCPVPILGVIEAGADSAAAATGNKKIGVIGTASTIGSEAYQKAILSRVPDAEVIGRSCPLFVPLVEEGLWEDPVTDEIARRYQRNTKTHRGMSPILIRNNGVVGFHLLALQRERLTIRHPVFPLQNRCTSHNHFLVHHFSWHVNTNRSRHITCHILQRSRRYRKILGYKRFRLATPH